MLSRTTFFLASALTVVFASACSSPYSNVYSFKKNTFKAPAPKTAKIAEPTPVIDPLQGQPGTVPGADPNQAIPGIPGLPTPADPSAPAVPGLEAPTPAPEAAPNPGTIPGLN